MIEIGRDFHAHVRADKRGERMHREVGLGRKNNQGQGIVRIGNIEWSRNSEQIHCNWLLTIELIEYFLIKREELKDVENLYRNHFWWKMCIKLQKANWGRVEDIEKIEVIEEEKEKIISYKKHVWDILKECLQYEWRKIGKKRL